MHAQTDSAELLAAETMPPAAKLAMGLNIAG